MAKFRVGRTDCYSFFGWTPEDEGRAASALVPPSVSTANDGGAVADEAGAAKKRKRAGGGGAVDGALRDGFGVEADAALIGALSALESSSASAATETAAALSTAATRAVTASRACGLELFLVAWKHPANVGAVLRLAGCFGVQRVHHVRRSAIRFVLRRRELGARRADAQRKLDDSRPRSLHLCLRRLRHGVLRLNGARPLPREGSARV